MVDNTEDAGHNLALIEKKIQSTLRALREKPLDALSLESYRASIKQSSMRLLTRSYGSIYN